MSRASDTTIHEAHASAIATDTGRAIREKYLRGHEEHGGYLPEKPAMLAHATDEVIDLAVYLHTMRTQLNDVRDLLKAGMAGPALVALERLLEAV